MSVSVIGGIPKWRPAMSSSPNRSVYLTPAARDLIDQIPRRPNHIRFYWAPGLGECWGPWSPQNNFKLPGGQLRYECNVGNPLSPNQAHLLRAISFVNLPDHVLMPEDTNTPPRALSQRLIKGVLNQLSINDDLGDAITDAATNILKQPQDIVKNYILPRFSRLIEDFWGQDFSDFETPMVGPSKVVIYVYGETLLPTSSDPDSPILPTQPSNDWRGGNDLETVVRALDRIRGILGVINQSITNLTGAQNRIPFINHLADILDLIGKFASVPSNLGDGIRAALQSALESATSAAMQQALDDLWKDLKQYLTDGADETSREFGAEFFNELVDDLTAPFYYDKRSISRIVLEKSSSSSIDQEGLSSVLDKYLMLPDHGGEPYNLADVASIHHTTLVIEEI